MKKVSVFIACCLAALALLPACQSAGGALAGTEWELRSYGPENSPTAILQGTRVTLAFNQAADRASGRAGCNSYGGECYIRGDRIDILYLFQTEMACQYPPGIMNQESTYLTLLQAARSFEIRNSEFIIYASGGMLVFSPAD